MTTLFDDMPAPGLSGRLERLDAGAVEPDEPEVRKPAVKQNAVPAKKAGSLADAIDEWDTDD